MAGEWKEKLLRDLLVTTKDGDWGKESPVDGYVPYHIIRGTDFPDVRAGELADVPLRYLPENTVMRRTLEPDDILIETAGGTRDRPTGRTLLITEKVLARFGGPVTCASFARFLRVDRTQADPRFVFWYLQHLYEKGELAQHQVQHTGVARFQYTRFAETQGIPLPPLPKQRAIAHILGTLDEKIELNRKMNETLEAMARVLFKSWFVEPTEGGVPKGWKMSTIRELCSNIQYGLTQSASADRVGPLFLRITDIQGGRIDWSTVPYCEVTPEECERYRIRPGDILVARTGASTGENIYISESPDAVFASYLVRFQFSDQAIARMVGAFMRTATYFDYVAGNIGGSAQPNASAQVLAGAELIVPPPKIVESFAELMSPLDKRIVSNNKESLALAAIRDALLPKLLSGEIWIKDAAKGIEALT